MDVLEKIKASLVENLAWETARAVAIRYGLGALMVAAAQHFVHQWLPTHDVLATLTVFVVAALSLYWITRRRSPVTMQDSSLQLNNSIHSGAAASLSFNGDKIMADAYKSRSQPEMERDVKAWMDSIPPAEKDDRLTKFIAIGLIAYNFDFVWWSIYKSQILALHELNRRMMRAEELKKFYDEAAKDNNPAYVNYPFERWCNYMAVMNLIASAPGSVVGITDRGRDFLQFLIHWGHSADDRKN